MHQPSEESLRLVTEILHLINLAQTKGMSTSSLKFNDITVKVEIRSNGA